MTVAGAIAVVLVVQAVATAVLDPVPQFLRNFHEPAVVTAVLVAAAAVVASAVVRNFNDPRRAFRRIATAALLVSLVPDIAVGVGAVFVREGWRLATVFMLQHVAAWAVVVVVLPPLMRVDRRHQPGE